MNQILTSTLDGVGYLTINRPDKRNAIGRQLLLELQQGIRAMQADEQVRVVVVQGAGHKAFSAGGDLKEFAALTPTAVTDWVCLGNSVFNELAALPKPTIALLRGYVLGGGLELALCCDFRIATPDALLGNPELQHGWLPGWGGLVRLRRLIGEARAKELILLGRQLPADEALRIGLITSVFSPDTIEADLTAMTNRLAQIPPDMASIAKLTLQDYHRTTTGSDLWLDVLATHHAKTPPLVR
jgi:enoyl-CoA hydratase/carnithine racemase